MDVGEIYCHDRFYVDANGALRAKYFVVFALAPSGDIVARLLTSRGGRVREPRCFHGDPYPGFHVGVPGAPLDRDTWIDLRPTDDFDGDQVGGALRKGIIRFITRLPQPQLFAAMECAAAAQDTTRLQERLIRDALARMR